MEFDPVHDAAVDFFGADWLDEPLPGLRHRSPRDAAPLNRLRPKVVELLKTLENRQARAEPEGEPAGRLEASRLTLTSIAGMGPAAPAANPAGHDPHPPGLRGVALPP